MQKKGEKRLTARIKCVNICELSEGRELQFHEKTRLKKVEKI